MKSVLLWAALALPLAAQPKLLVNAQVETRSASAGLDQQFHALLSAQPQPAWIAWSVPAVRQYALGCEYVSHDGWQSGTVHLEPPDHAVILFRVVANAVERIRALSPDCEIDAGGVPVHWLNDVAPAQSVALLASYVSDRAVNGNSAMFAIAMHADPSADSALDRFSAADQPQNIRVRAVNWLGSARGRHGFEMLKKFIASDPDERVRERAVHSLASSKEPEALDLLIFTARSDKDTHLRAQAAGALGRTPPALVLATLTSIVASDPDQEVQRHAVSALRELSDGQGVPALIDLVKSSKSADIRKHAMSALQQTHDPRAVSFFEQVLQ